jgi:hypothetical protein
VRECHQKLPSVRGAGAAALELAHEQVTRHFRCRMRPRSRLAGERRRDHAGKRPSEKGAALVPRDDSVGRVPRDSGELRDCCGGTRGIAARFPRLHHAGWRPRLAPLPGARAALAERRLLAGAARCRAVPTGSRTSLWANGRPQLLGRSAPVSGRADGLDELWPHVRREDPSRMGRLVAVQP